jgi:hypothetical protein
MATCERHAVTNSHPHTSGHTYSNSHARSLPHTYWRRRLCAGMESEPCLLQHGNNNL